MMHNRRARMKVLFFIFSVIHIAQCKYSNRRVDNNVGNGTGGKQIPIKRHGGGEWGDNADTDDSLQPIGGTGSDTHSETDSDSDTASDLDTLTNRFKSGSNMDITYCWFPMKTAKYFEDVNQLNDKYADDLEEFEKTVGKEKFDKEMLDRMIKTRSIAERALQRFGGEPLLIPAGINLGGYQMMRMPQSLLFFHRLKLRNNTRFRVNYLENNLKRLSLTVRLSLNDLHLTGQYERTLTSNDLSALRYRPSNGEVEFLLKDVSYNMEAYYRLLHDRLYIENIVSKLEPKEILMRYLGEDNTTPIRLDEKNIREYLLRLRNDLDRWLKDYFNDFLIFFGLGGTETNAKVQEYNNEKTIMINKFSDKVLVQARRRLRQLNSSSIKIPRFSLNTHNGMQLKLRDGVIRGLDSMYRRAVTTGSVDHELADLVTTIGFGNLKVEYKYDALTKIGDTPPLSGVLVLNGDELTARLKMVAGTNSDALELTFEYWQEAKPQALTIEGPANRFISNFKHLLEHHIVSIMSSSLIHYIHLLGTMTKCQPDFHGNDDNTYKNIDSDDSFEAVALNDEPEKYFPETTPAIPAYIGSGEPIEEAPSINAKPESDDENKNGHSNDDPKYAPAGPSDFESKYSGDDEAPRDKYKPQPGPTDDELPDLSQDFEEHEKPSGSKNSPAPTYVVSKNESVELEFPAVSGSKQKETMLLNVNEKFSLTKLKKGARKAGQR